MKRKVILICSVLGFLGLLSAALSFAAEAEWRNAQSEVTSSSTIICRGSSASGLGLAAAVALIVAQIIISVTTGCFCCRRGGSYHDSNLKWILALLCFVLSWITFGIAILLLRFGAALNEQCGQENMDYLSSNSYLTTPGVFLVTASLSLATVVLGIVYYLALDSIKISNGGSSWGGGTAAVAPPPTMNHGGGGGGIAMGQPHFPPTNTEAPPVFVHEDTYMRRQFP